MVRASASKHALAEAVKAYLAQPHTPELVTDVWQAIWQNWGEAIGLSLALPPCERTQREIADLENQGNMLIYVPEELSTQATRHVFDRIFSNIKSYAVDLGNPIMNDLEQFGWLDVEASVDPPNAYTHEEQLRALFSSQRRVGQTLNTYVVAAEASKLFCGRYFDETAPGSWSRLLGSSGIGGVVGAHFRTDGGLFVRWGWGAFRSPHMGGRSASQRK